jgi:cytochrome c-type biogenesis protein CcmH/NrfG
VPTADAHLGLGLCQVRERRLQDAIVSLTEANRIEPDNPVVSANLGIVYMDLGRTREAIGALTNAIDLDPDFHEARFNLVRAYARAGDRQAAANHARELLKRLPANAPQRSEVERLLAALQ